MTEVKERLYWEQMLEKYRSLWVALDNVIYNGPDVVEADVVCTLTEDERHAYEDTHLSCNYDYRYLGESDYWGYNDVEGHSFTLV